MCKWLNQWSYFDRGANRCLFSFQTIFVFRTEKKLREKSIDLPQAIQWTKKLASKTENQFYFLSFGSNVMMFYSNVWNNWKFDIVSLLECNKIIVAAGRIWIEKCYCKYFYYNLDLKPVKSIHLFLCSIMPPFYKWFIHRVEILLLSSLIKLLYGHKDNSFREKSV